MRSWDATHQIINAIGAGAIFGMRAAIWPVVVPITGLMELRDWIQKRGHDLQLQSVILGRDHETAERSNRTQQLTYVLSSIFLRECLKKLTPGEDEELYAVSGVRVGWVCIPHLLFPLEYEFSSPCGCVAKMSSSHARLHEMSEHGHTLLAMFHSHPGTGRLSVTESPTDIATQERFERSGYQAVTGIFSRDGFVRFFSNNLPFCVKVYGSGVKEVSHHVFRIQLDNGYMQDADTGQARCENGVRSAEPSTGMGSISQQ